MQPWANLVCLHDTAVFTFLILYMERLSTYSLEDTEAHEGRGLAQGQTVNMHMGSKFQILRLVQYTGVTTPQHFRLGSVRVKGREVQL